MTGEHPDAVLYRRLRSESAQLLDYDVANLTVAQQVQLDRIVAIRLALDVLTGRQIAGEAIDVTKLLAASEALERLLPRAGFNATVADDHSVRAKVARLVGGYRVANAAYRDERVAALEAEIAEKDQVIAEKDSVIAALGGATVAANAAPPTPPASPPAALPLAPTPPPAPQTSSQPPLSLHSSSAPYVVRRGGDGVEGGGRKWWGPVGERG